MSYPGRENVAAALFAVVSQAASFVTTSRKLRQFSDVDPAQMPALFVTQVPERDERTFGGTIGLNAKRTMLFEVWIYTADPQEDTVVPVTQLNNMVDAVEDSLAPDRATGALRLGGIAASARIDGQIAYFENLTGDGKSIAIIPVAVILP